MFDIDIVIGNTYEFLRFYWVKAKLSNIPIFYFSSEYGMKSSLQMQQLRIIQIKLNRRDFLHLYQVIYIFINYNNNMYYAIVSDNF